LLTQKIATTCTRAVTT